MSDSEADASSMCCIYLVSSSEPNLYDKKDVLFIDIKSQSEPYLKDTESVHNFSEDNYSDDDDDDNDNSSSSREWTSGDYDEVCSDDADGYDVVPVASDMQISDLEPQAKNPPLAHSKGKVEGEEEGEVEEGDDEDSMALKGPTASKTQGQNY